MTGILRLRPHRRMAQQFAEIRLRLRLAAARSELERIEHAKVLAITAAAQWRSHIHDLRDEQKRRGFAPEETYSSIDLTPYLNWLMSAGIVATVITIIYLLAIWPK